MDLPTRLDLFAIGRDYLRSRARKIDPNQVDVEGSDANLFVGSVSDVAYELVNQLVVQFRKHFLASCSGEDLDRYAWDRYRMKRKAASPGRVRVRFYRMAVTAGAGTVPVSTVVQTKTGVDYITVNSASFGATDLEVVGVNARSVQAGNANHAAKESIVRIPQASALFDPSIRVINDVESAHAMDREEDGPFRARIQDYWLTTRRGTLGAIAFGALETPGVASADVVEELDGEAKPARIVRLFAADEQGYSSPGLIIDLDEYRAAGIQVIRSEAAPEYVDIVYRLRFQAGKDTAAIAEQVRANTVGRVNQTRVNGPLFRGVLMEVLRSFEDDGLIPSDDSIVEPVGDLIPTQGYAVRTTMDRVRVL